MLLQLQVGRAAHLELCREGTTASWHVAHRAQVSGSPYYLFLLLNSSSKNNDFGPLGKPFKKIIYFYFLIKLSSSTVLIFFFLD